MLYRCHGNITLLKIKLNFIYSQYNIGKYYSKDSLNGKNIKEVSDCKYIGIYIQSTVKYINIKL